jgi:double-stranded uracil-DNA glycosylase
VDDGTARVYERRAAEWQRRRTPDPTAAAEFGAAVARARRGRPVVDLGCGPGWFTPGLGEPAIALDGARAMLDLVPAHAPSAVRVQADLARLPFRRGSLGAAYASKSYVHLPRAEVPLALADLHAALPVGAPAELVLFPGDLEWGTFPDDDFPGRRFSLWPERLLRDVLVGAGFVVRSWRAETGGGGGAHLRVRVTRRRTLADTVGPGMHLLVVGLNPSLHAAAAGVPFARPGNRFWPALIGAGLATRDRDPRHALEAHGIGCTDLVKRPTRRAGEVAAAEFRQGRRRLERLVRWLRPGAVCVVGITGWRHAVDARALAGPQPQTFGDTPVYLMPNPSGLNARTPVPELVEHLRAAARLAGRAPTGVRARWGGDG